MEKLTAAAIRAGEAGLEGGCAGMTTAEAQRLRDELLEALAEHEDEKELSEEAETAGHD